MISYRSLPLYLHLEAITILEGLVLSQLPSHQTSKMIQKQSARLNKPSTMQPVLVAALPLDDQQRLIRGKGSH